MHWSLSLQSGNLAKTFEGSVTRYRIDGEGRHWIGVEAESRGARSWRRGDLELESWEEVEFDRPVEWPLDARGDQVAAVITDSLEVQTVGVFRRSAFPPRIASPPAPELDPFLLEGGLQFVRPGPEGTERQVALGS